MSLAEQIAAAVARRNFGTASAVKRGRNPAFPHVPVIDHGPVAVGVHRTRTEQVLGKAFADRADAVAHAARVIEYRRTRFAEDLGTPRMRALRVQWGLPAEIEAPAQFTGMTADGLACYRLDGHPGL